MKDAPAPVAIGILSLVAILPLPCRAGLPETGLDFLSCGSAFEPSGARQAKAHGQH